MYRDENMYPCGLCNKPVMPGQPRVNFGRKTYHGECFVAHCKKNHNAPSDEEADVNDHKEDK